MDCGGETQTLGIIIILVLSLVHFISKGNKFIELKVKSKASQVQKKNWNIMWRSMLSIEEILKTVWLGKSLTTY